MCTLTAFHTVDGLLITMNRDESRLRFEAGLKRTFDSIEPTQTKTDNQTLTKQAVELAYPVDGQAFGTWIGLNNHGVVMCLLNRYQDAHVPNALTRGSIIPTALKHGQANVIFEHLEQLDTLSFNPFDLLVFSVKESRLFSWDGTHYNFEALHLETGRMFSSSSIDAETILPHRHKLFDAWLHQNQVRSDSKYSDLNSQSKVNGKLNSKQTCSNKPCSKKPLSETVLQGFHLQQETGQESRSVFMARDKNHTKSISQITLSNLQGSLDYYSEEKLQCVLNGRQKFRPSESVQLSLIN